MDAWFWSWWDAYKVNREHIAPLLAPLATFITGVLTVIVGGTVAFAALRQAKTATQQAKTAAQQAQTAAEQAETARKRHEEQIKTDRERADADRQRRITESFTKAVDQLSSDKLEVRLGGIYTLERITRDPSLEPMDYWTIMETLTGFVRERARWKDDGEAPSQIITEIHQVDQDKDAQSSRLSPPTDIAAVLTVIKRRDEKKHELERSREWRLDLSSTDLRGADLAHAHLEFANLSYTHLEDAELEQIHLEMANLTGAHLQRANFFGAHLGGARFFKAHLEEAKFYGTNLLEEIPGVGRAGTSFHCAHLEGALFHVMNIGAVILSEAHLHGTNFTKVRGFREGQLDDTYGDATTRLPPGISPPAHWLK